MKLSIKPIIGALVFALLLIASSYFLKGRAIGVWADAGIYMIGTYFWLRYFVRAPKVCAS